LFDILRQSYDGDKKKFINKHQAIVDLSRDLVSFYKPIIFNQFLVSSMQLCLIGFQIVMIENFFLRIPVVFFAVGFLIQIFVYALGGQLLMDKSASVAENFYDLDKDVIMIIARAQKAEVVKVGFFRADLPTFVSMMNSVWSLIAVLQSLME
jgi:hypothetical protein